MSDKKKLETPPADDKAPTETPPADTKAPEPTRIEYTSNTSGSIRDGKGDLLLAHVDPGDVIEPETAKLRRQLLDTGHFQPSRRALTKKEPTE